jgi:molybdopterin-containing oxidoreductase family iron-sulfur binding subunit
MANPDMPMSGRRKFLKLAVLGGAGAAMTAEVAQSREPNKSALDPARQSEAVETGNALMRMQQDVKRAMSKPLSSRSWMMVVDPRRCIGCNACTVACKSENVTPPGVSYRTVKEIETGKFPNISRIFKPVNCAQCDNPPCMKAAPPGAIYKRPDGIVAVDYAKFTSREAFEAARRACPYSALYYDDGSFYTEDTPGGVQPFETRQFDEYESKYERKHGEEPMGSVRKCHFCLHRLNAGMLPACVSTCIGGAMYFGDKNDPQSLVSEMLAWHYIFDINETMNTRPRLVFVLDDMPDVSRPSCAQCHY